MEILLHLIGMLIIIVILFLLTRKGISSGNSYFIFVIILASYLYFEFNSKTNSTKPKIEISKNKEVIKEKNNIEPKNINKETKETK